MQGSPSKGRHQRRRPARIVIGSHDGGVIETPFHALRKVCHHARSALAEPFKWTQC